MKHHKPHIKAIFVGASAGGVTALNALFKGLPANFSIPIIAVLHLGEYRFIPNAFYTPPGVTLKEADEKEPIMPKHIYFAPADYHLLVEHDFTFSLSTEEKIQYARPSLDITMETAAEAYKSSLLGIVLTGANEDGAQGLWTIKHFKGLAITQDLRDAEYQTMPQAAFKKANPDYVMSIKEMGAFLAGLEGTL
nr:chemotaxis protein CheB [Bacteriovorax sp. HI3]